MLALSLWSYSGQAQNSLQTALHNDFKLSRQDNYPLHRYWWAKDSSSIATRDTIVLHNQPNWYLRAGATGNICKFLVWEFNSKSTLSQSSYLPCVGHGYFAVSINGSGNYKFTLKESGDKTFLKLIDYKYQVAWFEVSRRMENDSASKMNYPAIMLVRLKRKPS